MDERVPAPKSKLPEYEVATNQLTWDLVHDSMAAQHPLLGQIRRVKVDHLPAEGAPHGVTVGFHAQPAELQYSFSIARTDVRELADRIADHLSHEEASTTAKHDVARGAIEQAQVTRAFAVIAGGRR